MPKSNTDATAIEKNTTIHAPKVQLPTAPDLIAGIVDQWKETAVEPLPSLMGTEIIGRIVRMNSLVSRKIDENLATFQLNVGEFDLLAVLLREPTHALTPSEIQSLILISSGGLSNRMTRLESRGLIERLPDPRDRRGVIVSLTPSGKSLIETVAPTHLAIENASIEMLSFDEQLLLKNLLKKILLSAEASEE